MSAGIFALTRHDEGIVSLRIATDDAPYIDPAWADGFVAALEALAGDASARVLMLEGGERYFSAGASRSALLQPTGSEAPLAYAARLARAVLSLPLPVLAVAAGHAIGGGLLLALWCEVIVLGEESLYGANFMALGFTPGMGATHVVPEAFGAPLGRDLLFTGRLLTGREIRDARCPLSHAVRPRAEVWDHAFSMAGRIAEAPREAIVLLKQNLAAPRRARLEQTVEAEGGAHARLFADPDFLAEVGRRYPAAAPEGSGSS